MNFFGTILLNLLIYGMGLYVIKRNGGIKQNLPFAFSWLIFIVYHFITPLYFYLSGRETIWGDEDTNRNVGVDISDYYFIGMNYYAIANLCFILGYLVLTRKVMPVLSPLKYTLPMDKLRVGVIVSFLICFSLVLFNFLNEGLNPILILFGDTQNEIAGITATSNYLKNFSDSIIALLIMAYFYKVKKPVFYLMVVAGFLLFVLMGFRYRIILTLIGMLSISLYMMKGRRFMILRYSLVGVVVLYFMFFLTYNRFVFTRGEWSQLEANPINFEYDLFFEQTRGMLDDITILKYYDTDPHARHDNGITFLYFLVRLMPRAIVGNEFKDSFYPFPAYTIFTEAYDVQKYWGKRNTGEAPLHMAYFVIAGGLPALFFGSFLVGLILKWVQMRFTPDNDLNVVVLVLVTSALFQWYTRGYFPGFVDHLGFMLLGFWIARRIAHLPKLTFHSK